MSWILQILALLNQLQSYPLVQEIEKCIFSNTNAADMWKCIQQKILSTNLPAGSVDAAIVDAAQALAGHAHAAHWGQME